MDGQATGRSPSYRSLLPGRVGAGAEITCSANADPDALAPGMQLAADTSMCLGSDDRPMRCRHESRNNQARRNQRKIPAGRRARERGCAEGRGRLWGKRSVATHRFMLVAPYQPTQFDAVPIRGGTRSLMSRPAIPPELTIA